ncbi:MAG TPA: hypothetical protein VNG29_01775 [Candidatus Paceibacterota bacterium]|nr:hypothetical protein [Candidatus Paceibacterota bacterium]
MHKLSIVSIVVIAAGMLGLSSTVLAAPFTAVNNPQIVANYPTGTHGIVGEYYLHTGADVVMRAGASGNFQQWFRGTSAENGGVTEGDHSVFLINRNNRCPNSSWMTVPNAGASWGSYLVQGAGYCVHTNDFGSSGGNNGI